MSVEVVLLVALSAHPALRSSHRNRAVLARLANRADKRGGGIRPAVGTIADRMDGGPTSDPAEREARDRRVRTALKELRDCGLLVESGERHGEPGKEIPVRRIVVGELARYLDPDEAGPALLRMFAATPDANLTPDPYDHPLIPMITPDASLTPDPEDHPTPDPEDHPTPDPEDQVNLSYEPVLEPVLNKRSTGVPQGAAETPSAPLVADAEVSAFNAAALAQRAALANRAPAGLRRSRAKVAPAPSLPLEAPAPVEQVEHVEQAAPPSPADIQPPKRTPGEARLEAATVTLLAELTAGRPKVAPKVLASWRTKLKARLSDGGVTAEAVEAAAVKIRKAWASLLASDWHAEKGLQSPGHLLERAERVEQLASRQPRPQNRWTRGGREMGQASTSANVNAQGQLVRDDGSLAW